MQTSSPNRPTPLDQRDPVEKRDKWAFFNHLTASHAISLHNMKNNPVSFKKYPFAFILILCDEIQDWGRGSHKSITLNENKQNKDFVALEWVEVKVVKGTPEIHFQISCTNERKKELIQTIKSRLVKSDDSEIKLVINSESIL